MRHLLTSADYPLPPTAQDTEILRVVVRESLSADLVDRLISDIVAVTERLANSEPVDLVTLQGHQVPAETRFRRERHGKPGGHSHKADSGHMKAMGEGVHKSVC